MDCSLQGSSIHGICQARVLEWVAIAFSGVFCYWQANQIGLQPLCSRELESFYVDHTNDAFKKKDHCTDKSHISNFL